MPSREATQEITVALPEGVVQKLAEMARLTDKSLAEVAAQTIVSNLPSAAKKNIRREEVIAIIAAHREQLQAMGVKSLDLFGSVARDEATSDSDVDFLVEFDKSVGLFEFSEVRLYLEDILGRTVEMGRRVALKEKLREKVIKEAIRVI